MVLGCYCDSLEFKERKVKPTMDEDLYRNERYQELEKVWVDQAENVAELAKTPDDEVHRAQRDALMEAGLDFKKQEAFLLFELEM